MNAQPNHLTAAASITPLCQVVSPLPQRVQPNKFHIARAHKKDGRPTSSAFPSIAVVRNQIHMHHPDNKVVAKKGVRLGTQMRGKATAAYLKRGNGSADIVLHYSFKARADVVLGSGLQHLHFLLVESDPHVQQAMYCPRAEVARLVGDDLSEWVHAIIETVTGRVIWRHAARTPNAGQKQLQQLRSMVGMSPLEMVDDAEVIVEQTITENPMRLRNANRAMAWIAGARHWPLHSEKKQILTLTRSEKLLTLGEIARMGNGPTSALFIAAALELNYSGVLSSDLNDLPLANRTVFKIPPV